ncbi:hypothetical protein D1007_53587 [Hordeum vulgare]|nr:hypothetical protein D1007_53587 [Hordeum vulgare]
MVGGSTSKRFSSQKPSSQAAWLGSKICEGHIEALRHHRLLPPASLVLVRIPGTETTPTPAVGEVVVFDEHFYRGFGLPASAFFSKWLHLFGLQPHNLAPNAILQLLAFVVFCEGFLGIEPRVDLWRNLFFFKQQSIVMEKSEVEKLAGPRPMMPCGAALVHQRKKSIFPQLPLQESIKQWQRGFFYAKNDDPAQDALNMPPFNVDPPAKLNWAAKTPKPIPEVAQISAYLMILEKEGLLGRYLLTTMVARQILPLHRGPHLVYQMGGRHDPCRLSTKRLTPSVVARRVNLISTAHMDDNGNWLWGMTPFNRSRPPPMMFEKLQGSLRPPAPGADVSDTSEIEDEGVIESRSDSSTGSEDALESEGTESSSEYPRPSVADWTDDHEIPSFLSDAAFEEDSDGVEEVAKPPLTRGRRQRAGATVVDETAGEKGKGATASRPAPKRLAPGPPAEAREGGVKKHHGAGRRQVPMVAGEAEDVEENTASAAERAGCAAADAAQRELEEQSKCCWDTAAGKTAEGQSRPSRAEKPTEKCTKARHDPSVHGRVEEPSSEAAPRHAPRAERAQPSEPDASAPLDLETIPDSPRAETAPDSQELILDVLDAAPDAPGVAMDGRLGAPGGPH